MRPEWFKRSLSPVFRFAKRILVGSPFDEWSRRCYYSIRRYWRRDAAPSDDDTATLAIMSRHLRSTSNCVDAGANAGFFLDHMLRLAPDGVHFAFEPIPWMVKDLRRRFRGKAQVNIYPNALAEAKRTIGFHHNIDRPAYSSIRKRSSPISSDRIREIEVAAVRLDDIVTASTPIAFIKIDVEGAELAVLRGAEQVISRDRPVVVFEFEKTGAEIYGSTPQDVYDFFQRNQFALNTLRGYLEGSKELSMASFAAAFETGCTIYYIAYSTDQSST